MKKQEYDSGHTATRIYKASLSVETVGRVTTHGRKLSYEDFLNALMRVSRRVYPKTTNASAAFEELLTQYVMPHAYSRGSRLPFGETAEKAAAVCTDTYVLALLSRFGDALHDIFQHANHRANRRHGMSKYDLSEAAAASSIEAVSHSELLSYQDYLYLVDCSFYFQHQQQHNILSVHDVGQIFIQVKEGGGHSIHPGHITFDEFLYVSFQFHFDFCSHYNVLALFMPLQRL